MDIQTELNPTMTFTTNQSSSKQTGLLLSVVFTAYFVTLRRMNNYKGEFGESCY